MALTIGIDVGGTKIAGGVVDEHGAVIARRRIETEAEHETSVVAGIAKVAQELRATAPAATAIGVGAAGLVDVTKGIVLYAPNINWDDVYLRVQVEDRAGLPTIVDNDANVGAYGEALHGAGAGRGDQVMVTVGTGIGGGIIVNGMIYRGARGIGAETGHMIIAGDSGALCACGNLGCFEAMASGNSIGRRARERDGITELVLQLAGGDPAAVTGAVVTRAAQAGDEWSRSILAETGHWLGIGLASLVNLLDPDIIIVAGGAAVGAGGLLLEPARATLSGLIVGRSHRTAPPVVLATLGDDAGVVGAAALARTLV